MERIRTIKTAYEEIKASDPNTAITEYRIRQLVITGEIPSRKAGNKYLINLHILKKYLEINGIC